MNRFFAAYIASAKGLASERGLTWDPPCDEYGIRGGSANLNGGLSGIFA